MSRIKDNDCVNIEMFPAILTVSETKTQTGSNHEKGISDDTAILSRKFVNSSVKSFGKKKSSKLSAADVLYVKTFGRLPHLWPSHSNKQPAKVSRQFTTNSKKPEYYHKSTEVCRVSYPCYNGCSTCAFTSCFGPVKVFYSQFKEPKEYFVREIRDGQGRNVIPKSRRKEFRGLVYDKQTHSLYPPLPRGHHSAHLQSNSSRKIFY